MLFKKFRGVAIAVLSLAIVTFSFLDPSSENPLSIPFMKKEHLNALSGFPGPDGEILVVKIDDTPFARPQAGLEDADIVYIEEVEGGLTRLAAVFSHAIPEKIGPIRSARITDIDLLSQFGYVAFAYSGAQSKFRPVIAAANLKDVGAERLGAKFYKNVPERQAPYAMMMNAKEVMAILEEKAEPIARAKSVGWRFGSAPDKGTEILEVKISWPAASYTATWSPREKRWLLSNSGIANLSESGKQLGPTTLVIQNVLITDSEYHDKVGGITPLSHLIGSGTGYILRDGRSFTATWSRESEASGTTWRDEKGREILFAPGQVWVALTDKAPLFTPKTGSQS